MELDQKIFDYLLDFANGYQLHLGYRLLVIFRFPFFGQFCCFIFLQNFLLYLNFQILLTVLATISFYYVFCICSIFNMIPFVISGLNFWNYFFFWISFTRSLFILSVFSKKTNGWNCWCTLTGCLFQTLLTLRLFLIMPFHPLCLFCCSFLKFLRYMLSLLFINIQRYTFFF